MTVLNTPLHELEPETAAAVDAELLRQQTTLEMIASENFAPLEVMEAPDTVCLLYTFDADDDMQGVVFGSRRNTTKNRK